MIDLKAIIGSWYRGIGKNRFEGADPHQQVFSPYDIPTALIDDMIARQVKPFTVQTISLAAGGELKLDVAGFHVVIYGHDNSANRAVNTTVFAEMWWGDTAKQYAGFPLKHGRGYSGPFSTLYLRWPPQANAYMDVVVHSGMHHPWIDGEACT